MNICKYLNYKFAHHHTHTEYSPMDAPVALKKLVKYSKELGYKTVTVTDHGTVSSWVKLQSYCKDAGLKPIFGIEGYFTPNRLLHSGEETAIIAFSWQRTVSASRISCGSASFPSGKATILIRASTGNCLKNTMKASSVLQLASQELFPMQRDCKSIMESQTKQSRPKKN